MAKIQFDIKYRPQIESGEYKVETRDGLPARIICWDKKEYADQQEKPTPIVYLVLTKGGCEHTLFCTTGGTCPDDLKRDYDLFVITPEPELTEFEKRVFAFCDGKTVGEELIKRIAKELLDYARVELVDEQTRREDLSFSRGLRQGREEAKKSPWIPASNQPEDDRLVFICVNDNGIAQCVGCGCYKHGVWVDTEDKLDYPDYWMEIPELPKEDE